MFGRLIKCFAYIVFPYQFIDLTIDYLKFNFLIEVNLDKSRVLPSATICFNVEKYLKNKLAYNNNIVFINNYTSPWEEFSGQILSRRKNNPFYITYFYDRQTEQGRVFF